MKTIDVGAAAKIDEILRLAEREDLIVRSADGKTFVIAEIKGSRTAGDFAHEVALTRRNETLRELLAERSREAGVYTLDEVRQELDLRDRPE
jgi:hypothetical protein